MMSSNEKLKCCKVPCVLIRNTIFENKYKYKHPEEYFHYMLFVYLLFRDENELKINNSYGEKLYLLNVLETINLNCIKFLWSHMSHLYTSICFEKIGSNSGDQN